MRKAKKIFITGGTGLLGSTIIETLLRKGYDQIVALSRNPKNTFNREIEWKIGDILDQDTLLGHMEGCDTVIHAAALVSFKRNDRKKLKEVNVIGTGNVVNNSILLGIKQFIHVSSVAVFARDPLSSDPISEETNWSDDLFHTGYALSKYQAELEVWRAQAEGVKVGIINPSIILGESDWHSGSSFIFKYAYNNPRFYPVGTSGYVDVRDVADFVLSILENEWYGENYILNGFNISHQKLLKTLCGHFNVDAPKKPLSGTVLKLAKSLAWLQAFVTKNESSLTLNSLKTSTQNNQYDSSRSRELGFQYRSMDETLKHFCAAYESKYNLNT